MEELELAGETVKAELEVLTFECQWWIIGLFICNLSAQKESLFLDEFDLHFLYSLTSKSKLYE